MGLHTKRNIMNIGTPADPLRQHHQRRQAANAANIKASKTAKAMGPLNRSNRKPQERPKTTVQRRSEGLKTSSAASSTKEARTSVDPSSWSSRAPTITRASTNTRRTERLSPRLDSNAFTNAIVHINRAGVWRAGVWRAAVSKARLERLHERHRTH